MANITQYESDQRAIENAQLAKRVAELEEIVKDLEYYRKLCYLYAFGEHATEPELTFEDVPDHVIGNC
jgi:hypothetical protein